MTTTLEKSRIEIKRGKGIPHEEAMREALEEHAPKSTTFAITDHERRLTDLERTNSLDSYLERDTLEREGEFHRERARRFAVVAFWFLGTGFLFSLMTTIGWSVNDVGTYLYLTAYLVVMLAVWWNYQADATPHQPKSDKKVQE